MPPFAVSKTAGRAPGASQMVSSQLRLKKLLRMSSAANESGNGSGDADKNDLAKAVRRVASSADGIALQTTS